MIRFFLRLRRERELDRELDEEIRTHFKMAVADRVAQGESRRDAEQAVRKEFGDVARVKEATREIWHGGWIERCYREVRFALRALRKSPAFTVTVILAMTLGIGVNTAVFSVVNAVLLKPLPFPNPDGLVAVDLTRNGAPWGPWSSPASFMYWRAQTDVFSGIAAISQLPIYLNYTGGDTPMQVTASRISKDYFRVMGVPLARGRPFTAEEDSPGGPKVVIISYGFWQRSLGGADVLGKHLSLGGSSYTIVGIMGRKARELDPYFEVSAFDQPDLLMPYQLDPNSTNVIHEFNNVARLRPRVTLAQAQSRLAASAAGFRQRFPVFPKDQGFTVLRVRDVITTMYGDPHARLWVLLGAVGFVLLIACANVASLLLMRATGRGHEIAIRSFLGAGRAHIIRQLLTESLLLSLAGGVLGLIAGFLCIHVLLAVNTAGLPLVGPGGSLVGLDWRVVGFTLALSLATGVVFGLVPAFVGSRADLNAVIKASGSRSGGGLQQSKARSLLVVAEVGLAVVLLIGAALLIRTSLALGRVDPGFDPSHVLTMRTPRRSSQYPTAAQSMAAMAATLSTALERVRAIPGVEGAAASCCIPLQGDPNQDFDVVGRPHDSQDYTGDVRLVTTSEGYLAALHISVIRGRAFNARDNEPGASPVALISQAAAKRYWANGQDPLQDSIVLDVGTNGFKGGPERRIVGIVGDVHYESLGQAPQPTIYAPIDQMTTSIYASIKSVPIGWVVRTRSDSAAVTADVKRTIAEATGAPAGVEPMAQVLSHSVSHERLNMLLMSLFGGGALLLAAIGLYGLMAHSVQQRVHEIGIRMALGADARRVSRDVVHQGMLLVVTGIAAGLVAAFYTADVLSSLLFEVKPRDPAVFVAVPIVLALIALVSVWLPARRASRVNPLEALRYE